jgi:tetratricopeptide (TPR) repeat protein
VLFAAKRYDDAAEVCKAAIATAKQPKAYQMMLAQSYLEADRHDEALAAVKQIGASDRDELVERLDILILLDAKRYDQALKIAKRAVARAREVEVRQAMTRTLVLIYQRQGRMDLAEKELEKIYADEPGDPGINNDLGYTWGDAGKHLDKAELMVRYALGEEPRNAAYMDSLGWVLYKKGAFDEAAHYLRKATRAQGGDDPVIFDHLGDAYWRLGKEGEAKKSWQQAVALSLKERDEDKDPVDPQTLPRVRKKLEQLKRGGQPAVADVVTRAPATRGAGQAVAEPSSAPASQ